MISVTPSVSAKDVQVGLYMLNLGKFDIATGAFTADFYLSMKCDGNCSADQFEFSNGRATSIEKVIDKPGEKFYRIQANLASPIDLRKFPFDSQVMEVQIEDKTKKIDELRYVPILKESGIDPSISFPGWELVGWSATVKDHAYEVYDETYSRFNYKITISRIYMSSFLKTFLPVLFIMAVVLLSFIIDPDKVTTRLTMAGSSLVSAVMFHVSISNQIPPVGYLTFADKFMAVTYLILMFRLTIDILMLEFQERKQPQIVEKIHHYTEFPAMIVGPILYIVLFVFFL